MNPEIFRSRFAAGIAVVVASCAATALLGCAVLAARHQVWAEGDGNGGGEARAYYVVLATASGKVDYLQTYTEGRFRGNLAAARPDVPREIVRYLLASGKSVVTGPRDSIPHGDTAILEYSEIWGWDVGSILKYLEIRQYRNRSSVDTIKVLFSEFTLANTHPTARSLVPKMMDTLISRSRSGAGPLPHI